MLTILTDSSNQQPIGRLQFKGRRVLYELALKELYAQYAGVSMPGQVTYFDSVYGIGSNARPLR